MPVLLRARGRLGPRRHPHPGHAATATTGSSTARRSGAPGAYYADWAMCLARTDWDVPKHRGLTWFAVPTDAKGVTVRQITQINGNAEFCEEFLDDVVVTDDDLIGEVNQGWTVTQTMLVYERGAGESNVAVLEPRAAGARSRRAGPPRSAAPTIRSPARRSPGPTSTTTPSSTSGAGSPPACGPRPSPDPPSPPTASWPPARSRPIRARLALEIGGSDGAGVGAGDDEAAAAGHQLPQRPRRSPSPPAPTRCSATASASACSACPREPSFDTTKPFNEVVNSARNWDHRVQ